MNHFWRGATPHIISIVVLIAINYIFFLPMYQGQVLYQGDIISAKSFLADARDHEELTGEKSYWSNAMFSGMPFLTNYGKQYNATSKIFAVTDIFAERPASLILRSMLFCYIGLIFLGVNPWISLLAAISFGLSTNHIVVLEAGHNSKMATIANFPLLMAGFILAFRNKYLLGGLLFAVGLALSIYTRHPQMLYYLFLAFLIGGVVYLVQAAREKTWMQFGKAVGALALAMLLGLGAGYTHIYAIQKFSSDTMRGKAILEASEANPTQQSSSNVEGLDWEYAMQWSNGTLDLFTTFIPGLVGGSSGEAIGPDDASARLFRGGAAPRAPLYWGPLPFTSGPTYYGAVIFMLFLLGLLMTKKPYRIWMGLGLLLMFLLSMGKNFEVFNRLFFDFFPFYNKFRTPNSIMVVAGGVFVFAAALSLQDIVEAGRKGAAHFEKKLYYVVGAMAAICLFFVLMGGSFFGFEGAGDQRYQREVVDIFIQDRKIWMQSDAFRSLAFVLLGGGLIWAYWRNYIKLLPFLGLIGLVTLVDILGVTKRYIREDNYISERQYEQNFQPREVDQQIKQLEPQGRGYYRVLDLSINTFNSSSTSEHHNTIGGYYAAKLQRYQDLIDWHISKNNMEVLNMLNTKYIISQDQKVQGNNQALGNAWFVRNIKEVNTPNEEIEALNNFSAASDAVILKSDFPGYLDGFSAGDGLGSIRMTAYKPSQLTYETETTSEQLAVFSEIWYGQDKGWTVTLDGEEVDHIRANYVLRAMKVPAGKHTIQFTFDPKETFGKGRAISLLSSSLLLLGLLGFIGFTGYKEWQKEPEEPAQAEPVAEKPVRKRKSSGKKPAQKSGPKRKKPKK